MACAHEVWERDVAAVADGLCPLCLRAMLALSERRLAESEKLRTGLVGLAGQLRERLSAIIERVKNDPDVRGYELADIAREAVS